MLGSYYQPSSFINENPQPYLGYKATSLQELQAARRGEYMHNQLAAISNHPPSNTNTHPHTNFAMGGATMGRINQPRFKAAGLGTSWVKRYPMRSYTGFWGLVVYAVDFLRAIYASHLLIISISIWYFQPSIYTIYIYMYGYLWQFPCLRAGNADQ